MTCQETLLQRDSFFWIHQHSTNIIAVITLKDIESKVIWNFQRRLSYFVEQESFTMLWVKVYSMFGGFQNVRNCPWPVIWYFRITASLQLPLGVVLYWIIPKMFIFRIQYLWFKNMDSFVFCFKVLCLSLDLSAWRVVGFMAFIYDASFGAFECVVGSNMCAPTVVFVFSIICNETVLSVSVTCKNLTLPQTFASEFSIFSWTRSR